MKNLLTLSVLTFLFLACSEDDESIVQANSEDFYVNLRVGSTFFHLDEENYHIERGEEVAGCIDNFTYGMRYTDLVYKEQTNHLIASLRLGIYKKVLLTDLGAPNEISPGVFRSFSADSLRYMRETLYERNFGASYATILPININRVDPLIVRDSVNHSVLAEAFLTVRMHDEEYLSFSDNLTKREKNSYLWVNHILKLPESDKREYQYIMEGEFKVDLYRKDHINATVVEGDFRLPIYTYYTQEALAKCE